MALALCPLLGPPVEPTPRPRLAPLSRAAAPGACGAPPPPRGTSAGRPKLSAPHSAAVLAAAAVGAAARQTGRARRAPVAAVARSASAAGPGAARVTGDAKEELLRLCEEVASSNGTSATPEEQRAIGDALAALAAGSGVKQPATRDAAALDGNWVLLYTTSKGPSAGFLGPFLGEVTQAIDIPGGEYVNFVSFAGGAFRLALRANWTVLSDKDWRVNFLDIGPELFGSKLFAVGFPPDRGGTWAMSYTDEDLRVVWTETSGGVTTRDGTRNVFVLARRPA